MSPVRNSKVHTEREFLGMDTSVVRNTLGPERVAFYMMRAYHHVELYRDHRGWHLEARIRKERQ